MMKTIKSFGWAMHGLATVWREERNFRIQTALGVLVLVWGFFASLATVEWIIIIACIGAVLGAEIINTAVEDLCNKVEPETDPVIGKIKDIMAGFVFVVCGVALCAGVLLVYAHYTTF